VNPNANKPVADRPLRLGYVIRDLRFGGGTENHLMQLFAHLDRRRFAPALYLLREHGELIETVRELDVPVYAGNMKGSLLSPSLLPGVVAIARAFRRDRIDVVHTYLPRGELVGSLAARLARVPVLVCGKRGCHYRRGAEAVGCRIANRLADCVLGNAQAVKDFVAEDEGCPRRKIAVIENGVDTARFAPVADRRAAKERVGLDPDRPAVGTITRARVRKGYEEFLRAMAEVRRVHPGAQVVVIGQDTVEQAPLELIAALGLGDDIHLLGLRSDIPELLAAMDVFVLSSHDEGMSNAIMEAMSVGRPIVATDVGGAPEMIEHGVGGLLVPPKVVEPLAAAIQRMLDDPAAAEAMGAVARRTVESRFSIEVMIERIASLYEALWRARQQGQRVAPPIHESFPSAGETRGAMK
jgi:glycosyltransferase involved in cell wall biosynthesis